MIGYGHMANGEWKYRCFCVDCLAEESEERIVVKGGEKTYQRGGAKPYH